MAKGFEVTSDLYASHRQRFGNYFIDLVVQIVLLVALEIVIIVICNLFEIYAVEEFLSNTNRLEDYILGIIITLMYYIPFEILVSRSVGKYITGTLVVLENGTKPDAQTIIKRSFCRLIPFDVFSFLGSDARGWHDSMSQTYVVSKKGLEVKMKQFYEFDQIGKINEED